jgi:hypothetical protein
MKSISISIPEKPPASNIQTKFNNKINYGVDIKNV